MRIKYLSFGKIKTGGYRHESILFQSLSAYFSELGQVEAIPVRKERYFENIFAYFTLLSWSYKQADGDINIVTVRSALPAILRNRFNKKEVWTVIHNFDPNDGKSKWMTWYYKWLFKVLIKKNDRRFKVITVSSYWNTYFKNTIGLPHTFIFPNLFDLQYYQAIATDKKNPWIHLGQLSSKNDPEIFRLAEELVKDGYYCYFSTMDEHDVRHNGNFEIIKFESFRDYLEQMARCCCTLALTEVNEGWNRVAHESLLVGTPVIGYDRGGLGDLLRESNSIIVKNIDEAYTCIRESLWVLPEKPFYDKYGLESAYKHIEEICRH